MFPSVFPGGSVYRFLLDTADRIILELNPNMPYVYGQDNIFNINDADAIVMSDKAIPEMAEGEPDEITEKISNQIVPLSPDGAHHPAWHRRSVLCDWKQIDRQKLSGYFFRNALPFHGQTDEKRKCYQ